MTKSTYRFLVALCFLKFIFALAFAQQPSRDAKTLTLSKYDINQYISSSGSTPHNIMNLDNNGEIVLACIKGKTRKQLQAEGIKFVESQIQLMKTWRILQEEDDILKTSFPILNEKATKRLRSHSIAAVPAISKQLRPDILRFISGLKSIERVDNAYTILFSYVLDELVWHRFGEKGLLEERETTLENPFWAGGGFPLFGFPGALTRIHRR